jgi:hypothetical protein
MVEGMGSSSPDQFYAVIFDTKTCSASFVILRKIVAGTFLTFSLERWFAVIRYNHVESLPLLES